MKKSVILCVDDEKMVLTSLKSELKEAFGSSYLIEVCENPLESLEILKELLDDGYEVPLVISDYVMPVMKGDELLCKINEIAPETNKIMLTGQATTEGVTNAVNGARLYRYISKPWESNDLCLTVKEAVRSFFQERKVVEQNNELKLLNQELEKKVQERTAEIIHKNEELNIKNQSITDSIRAASMIQQALLPSKRSIETLLPPDDYFVLYKPKDIVSGDFYWLKNHKRYEYFAVADCTGHGVPGALMSMLGISILNEIVGYHSVKKPSEILNELRSKLILLLNQENRDKLMREGMDISFCMIDKITQKMHYAGAYNPVYLVRQNKESQCFELQILTADRMPIGLHPSGDKDFTDVEIQLFDNDRLFMFSDGYTSQFGGEDGKKLKPRQFQEYLLSIQNKPMDLQKDLLDKYFEDWRADGEQIDDVLVAGVKIDSSLRRVKR